MVDKKNQINDNDADEADFIESGSAPTPKPEFVEDDGSMELHLAKAREDEKLKAKLAGVDPASH